VNDKYDAQSCWDSEKIKREDTFVLAACVVRVGG